MDDYLFLIPLCAIWTGIIVAICLILKKFIRKKTSDSTKGKFRIVFGIAIIAFTIIRGIIKVINAANAPDDLRVGRTIIVLMIILLIAEAASLIVALLMKKGKVKKISTIICIGLVIPLMSIVFLNKNKKLDEYSNVDNGDWNTELMEYDVLHKYSKGEGITIALIDTGISEYNLEDEKTSNYSLTDGKNKFDENGHGTMIYSLIRGYGDIIGICPKADIISYKVAGEDGTVDADKLIEAVTLAANKADIINISMGSYKDNDKLKTAIDKATDKGIIVVAAAGDYESADMLYPAAYENVVSVGALMAFGEEWKETNAVESCDILAPGYEINAVGIDKCTIKSNGTSQACALVSGYLAILKDIARDKGEILSLNDCKNILSTIKSDQYTFAQAATMFKQEGK